jgi:S-methylmethionine-dependent homocysteine/selenocysteine methylase
MPSLSEIVVERGGFLVLDGGFSTCLEASGVEMHKELWSGLAVRDARERVVTTHRAFVDAGADIITASTYQMTLQGLIAHGGEQMGMQLSAGGVCLTPLLPLSLYRDNPKPLTLV